MSVLANSSSAATVRSGAPAQGGRHASRGAVTVERKESPVSAIHNQPIMLMQETAGDLPLALRQLPAIRHSYHRGAVIYRVEQAADAIYLILSGRVRLTRVAGDGRESVLHVLKGGEVFGELAALDGQLRQEQASALDDMVVAAWPAAEVHRRAQQTPQLAAWFSNLLARRLQEAHDRIETLSFDPIPKRLARVILRHAHRFGTVLQDGRIRALPLTHEALAQEVATSREIITHHMNHFRARGLLNYSRKAIEVAPDRLSSVLI